MEFGYPSGNRAEIPTPPNVQWREETALLKYLYFNDAARAEVFALAKQAQIHPCDSVWMDHPLLFHSFCLHPFTTDIMFKTEIYQRLMLHIPPRPPYLLNHHGQFS